MKKILLCLLMASSAMAFDASDFAAIKDKTDTKGNPVVNVMPLTATAYQVTAPVYDTRTGAQVSQNVFQFKRDELQAQRDALQKQIDDIDALTATLDQVDVQKPMPPVIAPAGVSDLQAQP